MSKSLKTLFTLSQFNKLHHDKQMSIYQIAEKYDTYPNKVRRHAQKLGANIRNKSQAQKVALKTGRQTHPTKGKTRDESVKIKISESIADVWESMPTKEKKRRSKLASDQWKNMTDKQKQHLQDSAYLGIRNASKNGSKLEIEILEWLVDQGYKTTFHKQHIIGNEKMHLDILLHDFMVAIEVDGPSHFQPIWGQEKLKKSQEADDRKDGVLLGAGYSIIRIMQKKEVTKKLVRDIIYKLEDVLSQIEKKKDRRRGTRRFVIGE